jgi:hypothetical protein
MLLLKSQTFDNSPIFFGGDCRTVVLAAALAENAVFLYIYMFKYEILEYYAKVNL